MRTLPSQEKGVGSPPRAGWRSRQGRSCGRFSQPRGEERAMTDEGDLRQRAIANLKKKREFATHLLAYVLVNAFLVAIWAVTSDGTLFWPIFPILGWGI